MKQRGSALVFVLIAVLVLAGAFAFLMFKPSDPRVVQIKSPDPSMTPAVTPPTMATLSAEDQAATEDVFMTRCASCHGIEGEGMAGPSLVDDIWLHGQSPEDIRRSIREGYPKMGMIGMAKILSEDEIENMIVYVLGLSAH